MEEEKVVQKISWITSFLSDEVNRQERHLREMLDNLFIKGGITGGSIREAGN
jgi:hypothetical protein